MSRPGLCVSWQISDRQPTDVYRRERKWGGDAVIAFGSFPGGRVGGDHDPGDDLEVDVASGAGARRLIPGATVTVSNLRASVFAAGSSAVTLCRPTSVLTRDEGSALRSEGHRQVARRRPATR